jgi:hypothetical protein
MPADPKEVPCLFCTKNPRRNPDSDFCQPCWDEWKRTGVKRKALIHGDGTPIQPVPVVTTPTQQAASKAPATAKRAALLEEDEPLTAEDLFKLQHPMLTINGKQYVRCTECKERPLKIARICEVCYEKRMKAADMKSQYNVVKRGIGKPKFECPYCYKTVSFADFDLYGPCCIDITFDLREIEDNERKYLHATAGEEWDLEAL